MDKLYEQLYFLINRELDSLNIGYSYDSTTMKAIQGLINTICYLDLIDCSDDYIQLVIESQQYI